MKTAKTMKDAMGIETVPNGPHGWVQWKGTDVCMDIHCICGEMSHIDGDFVYEVRCPHCKRAWYCNGNIELILLENPSENCKESSA